MMQKKKNLPPEQESNWQEGLKKEQQKQTMKKVAIWGAAILISLAGLAGLVKLAQSSDSGATTQVASDNLPQVTSRDIVLGNKEAKITIIEYADFQCPACASYNPVINKVLADYDGKVRVVYRFFPLTNIHKNAVISGQAGYAAYKLGKFEDMKNILFEKQADWENIGDPREVFEGYASSIGLNVEEFRTIMNSTEAKKAVLAGETEASKIGLNSTPSFFLGNKFMNVNGYDSFKEQIDKELNIQKPLQ